jgi:lysophospholipase L1-like esterase
VNPGHDSATTVSFVEGSAPNRANITSELQANNEMYDCWVTIQFGHNDQKPAANISLSEYQTNLQNLAEEVKELGGHPARNPSCAPTNLFY